jgi:P-type Ca2+ transporter type 2C
MLLAEGERVPADLDLVQAANLAVDESMLTGESVPVNKLAGTPGPAPGGDGRVHSGTLVTQGTARGVVVATGARSTLGRIGQSLAALGGEQTPIQQEMHRIVKRVAAMGLALAAALAHGLTRGDWLRGLLVGLTLAMAIVPEELPVVLTLFLGLGAWRLSRQKVLARHSPAIERLGAVTLLCVDKTGTLTANHMAVRRLWCPAAAYDRATAGATPLQEDLHPVLEFAVLASHRRAFDPMETAIGECGQHLLADTEHLHGDWTLVDDYPLSPRMLAMSRVWQSPDRRERVIAAKGAPEAIIDLCHLDAAHHAAVATQAAAMAGDGLRVLGVARATFQAAQLPGNQHDFEFQFLGLVALEDPVRPEVPEAMAQCRAAGIRVVMITGDHPATALSIARQAGLRTDGGVMTGAELSALSDAGLGQRLADTQVFCRVQPEQKLRLVQAFRARGEVVAMTGDGVNDAPALKAAHIGVAMGARGTDVAREAAALVLLDDNFASLVTAVRHDRRVFANLRKAIAFVIAVHVPIVGLSVVPVLLGWPMLLMPVHVWFLQLIIDPACSVVFEAEPLEAEAMNAPPRRPEARLFDAAVGMRDLWQGVGLLALLLAVYPLAQAASQSGEVTRAMVFMVLVLGGLALIFVNRSWATVSLPGRCGSNRAFVWIASAAVALLGAVLLVPPIAGLFAFATPTPTLLLLLASVAAAGLGLLWFEAAAARGLRAARSSLGACGSRDCTVCFDKLRPCCPAKPGSKALQAFRCRPCPCKAVARFG